MNAIVGTVVFYYSIDYIYSYSLYLIKTCVRNYFTSHNKVVIQVNEANEADEDEDFIML